MLGEFPKWVFEIWVDDRVINMRQNIERWLQKILFTSFLILFSARYYELEFKVLSDFKKFIFQKFCVCFLLFSNDLHFQFCINLYKFVHIFLYALVLKKPRAKKSHHAVLSFFLPQKKGLSKKKLNFFVT